MYIICLIQHDPQLKIRTYPLLYNDRVLQTLPLQNTQKVNKREQAKPIETGTCSKLRSRKKI